MVKQDTQFDVVVIGGGGSGLACAAVAAERGAKVLLLEKRPTVGGTTGIAIGSFTASRTRLQAARGIEDKPLDHAADAALFGPCDYQLRNNHELRSFFLEHAADTLHWMMDLGLAFHGPSPEPPNRVPRMHNVVPNAKAYIALFQQRFLRYGGTLMCDTAVDELVKEDGRICGVRTNLDGQRVHFRASTGVVLAAGDYANSPDMIRRFKGPGFDAVEGINPHATGDGHRLAEQAGARMVNMDITYGPELRFVPSSSRVFEQLLPSTGWGIKIMSRLLPLVPQWLIHRMIKRLLVTWQHPEDALFRDGAILLNARGQRFCDELQSPNREIALASQPGKIAYILLDEWLCQRYSAWPHFISTAPEIAYAYVDDYSRLRPDIAAQHAELAQVCKLRELPLASVEQTLNTYNAALDQIHLEFCSDNNRSILRRPLRGSRWLLLGPVKAYFTTTEGGAAIDRHMQVLDADGQPIPGLYAVGQNGLGGMVLWGHGLHIAWAITSGRLVGQALGEAATGQRAIPSSEVSI